MPIFVVILALLSLAAAPAAASTQTFTNANPIAINDLDAATPYPSSIPVSGMPGAIVDVNVTLHRFTHTAPIDVDILLVSPAGDAIVLMSDACARSGAIDRFTWVFDQQAPGPMVEPCNGFVYKPTNVNGGSGDFFGNAPPPPPYGSSLNDFNNENANGTWALYVQDDAAADTGALEGGWSVTITTGPVDAIVPATGSVGPANPYPITSTVTETGEVITDLDVLLDGIWHQRPDDLDLLLVGPRGQKVVLTSDACGASEAAAFGWIWDDEAMAPMPDDGRCLERFYRPTDHEPGDLWPAPAPPGPYATTLSAFDLTDPVGDWHLFVVDDTNGKVGFFTNRFQLSIQGRAKAPVAFTESAVELSEGTTRSLTVRRSGPAALGEGSVLATGIPVTAASVTDFRPVSTVVPFAPGETEKTIEIEAFADDEREPDESFVVTIGSPTGDAAVGSPSSVAVTIPGAAAAPGEPGDPREPGEPGEPGGGAADGPSAVATPPAFGASTLVTLALADRRIAAAGRVAVRVANANPFAVSGALSARNGAGVSPSRSFTAGARSKAMVQLRLPKTVRRLLKRKGRLSLRLTARVKDPAGHTRSVTKAVRVSRVSRPATP